MDLIIILTCLLVISSVSQLRLNVSLNCDLFAGGISKAIGWERVEGQQSFEQRLQNSCFQEQASSSS